MLVKDANESKTKMEKEMYQAELKERREAVRIEEAKIRESLEQFKQIRET
jgi:hypothetical protein